MAARRRPPSDEENVNRSSFVAVIILGLALAGLLVGMMPETAQGKPGDDGTARAGDVNCDGAVTSVDASLILQFHAGLLATLSCEDVADVDADGRINAIDAFLVLQYSAGLIDKLPPPAPPTPTPCPCGR